MKWKGRFIYIEPTSRPWDDTTLAYNALYLDWRTVGKKSTWGCALVFGDGLPSCCPDIQCLDGVCSFVPELDLSSIHGVFPWYWTVILVYTLDR
jgi:hypothetical protein